MIERITKVYVADDGEEFGSAEECERYEYALKSKDLIILDCELNPCSFANSEYLVVCDEEDAKIIDAFCNLYSYCNPYDKDYGNISTDYRGILKYDNGTWVTFDNFIEELLSVKAKILSYVCCVLSD